MPSRVRKTAEVHFSSVRNEGRENNLILSSGLERSLNWLTLICLAEELVERGTDGDNELTPKMTAVPDAGYVFDRRSLLRNRLHCKRNFQCNLQCREEDVNGGKETHLPADPLRTDLPGFPRTNRHRLKDQEMS